MNEAVARGLVENAKSDITDGPVLQSLMRLSAKLDVLEDSVQELSTRLAWIRSQESTETRADVDLAPTGSSELAHRVEVNSHRVVALTSNVRRILEELEV